MANPVNRISHNPAVNSSINSSIRQFVNSSIPLSLMSLNEKIGTDIATAMKAKDAPRLSALRMLKAAVMNKGVEKGRDLDDAEVLQVVASLVKQRRDSIEQFTKAGRTDLVDKETAEIIVLEAYLPPAASAAEIDDAIAAAIAETGAT